MADIKQKYGTSGQALTITLYAMKVPSMAVKAFKAIVIIAIVVLGSPVVKHYAQQLRDRLFRKPMSETENNYYGIQSEGIIRLIGRTA